MQRLEVSCAVRLIYTSLGAKGLISCTAQLVHAGTSGCCMAIGRTLWISEMENRHLYRRCIEKTSGCVLSIVAVRCYIIVVSFMLVDFSYILEFQRFKVFNRAVFNLDWSTP